MTTRLDITRIILAASILIATAPVTLARGADALQNAEEDIGLATQPAPVIRISKACPPAAYQPLLESGYLPYAYPAFDTCPCGADVCFPPWPYYCGGKPYKTEWFHRWLGAHLGHAAILDAYPCPCIYPMTGRLLHLPQNGVAADHGSFDPGR